MLTLWEGKGYLSSHKLTLSYVRIALFCCCLLSFQTIWPNYNLDLRSYWHICPCLFLYISVTYDTTTHNFDNQNQLLLSTYRLSYAFNISISLLKSKPLECTVCAPSSLSPTPNNIILFKWYFYFLLNTFYTSWVN